MDLIKISNLTSWLEVQSDTWIPSPYLICPHPMLVPENQLLALCIRNFIFPPDYETDPYWKIPIGQTVMLTKQIVFGRFIREFIDKDFPLWKMPRHWSKTVKQCFNCQAEVVEQLWHTLQLIQSHNPQALVFQEIISERTLVFCHLLTKDKDGKIPTATEWVKTQQKINQAMQDIKNPFDSKVEPETWRFVEQAREVINSTNNKRFRKEYFGLIRRRMTMISNLRNHPRIFDQLGNIGEMRGRKGK